MLEGDECCGRKEKKSKVGVESGEIGTGEWVLCYLRWYKSGLSVTCCLLPANKTTTTWDI